MDDYWPVFLLSFFLFSSFYLFFLPLLKAQKKKKKEEGRLERGNNGGKLDWMISLSFTLSFFHFYVSFNSLFLFRRKNFLLSFFGLKKQFLSFLSTLQAWLVSSCYLLNSIGWNDGKNVARKKRKWWWERKKGRDRKWEREKESERERKKVRERERKWEREKESERERKKVRENRIEKFWFLLLSCFHSSADWRGEVSKFSLLHFFSIFSPFFFCQFRL